MIETEPTAIPKTGIKMTKKNRLAILKRARAIITPKSRWTKGRLRRKTSDGEFKYCLLGACEQAAYELDLAEKPERGAFSEHSNRGLGYALGNDLSLWSYSREKYCAAPYTLNDTWGHEGALRLLDEYIDEVEKGKARKPKGD